MIDLESNLIISRAEMILDINNRDLPSLIEHYNSYVDLQRQEGDPSWTMTLDNTLISMRTSLGYTREEDDKTKEFVFGFIDGISQFTTDQERQYYKYYFEYRYLPTTDVRLAEVLALMREVAPDSQKREIILLELKVANNTCNIADITRLMQELKDLDAANTTV